MKRNRFGFFSGFLTALLLVGLIGSAMAASSQRQATLDYSGIKITLDGKAVTPTDANGTIVEPFAIDGTTYLPVRGIASALGLDVAWDGATQTVALTGKTAEPTATPSSGVTTGQQNAIKKAQSYLNVSAFSRSGLINQLEYEKFSTEDATYAADNCGANWNEQAAKKAKSYLDIMSFSRAGLIDQLEYEGFTYDQAVYGVEANGY